MEEISGPGKIMKILLTMFLCSTVAGECMPPYKWPELFRDESVGRYIRLRNLMPQYLGPQEILSNILVAVGEIELGKNEAEIGIKMSDSAGLPSAQSWWVKGEAERVQNNIQGAIDSFKNSIDEASISTNLDYNDAEHRDFKFLVLANL